jgi:acetyltransferase
MSIKNLDVFFNPRRIAVLGANEDKSSLGYHIFRNLIGKGFKGVVYPVHPLHESIQGVEAYKNINDIQQPIDLAILAGPPDKLYGALDECGQKDVKSVLILSPNFEYRVKEPEVMTALIRRISSIYGFRVLGPNSFGFLRPSKNLNATIFPYTLPQGNIAFISQGGIFSSAFLERAVSKNVGFSYFISLGTNIDIDCSDLIDFLGIDTETRAIILYLRKITGGRKFMTAVRSFASSKPIVVVKSGKFEVSEEAVLTHSGFAAVEDKIYEAAFKRAGAVRVDEMLDLFYMAETLSKQRRPKGKRLAIISNSLGPSSIAVDALMRFEGELASLTKVVIEDIERHMPLRRQFRNPIALLSDASAPEFELALKDCLKDRGVDGVLVIYLPFPGLDPKDIAKTVVSAAQSNPYVPIFTTWMGDMTVLQAREFLNSRGIPTFVTPEQAVKSFIYMYRYDYNLKLLQETPEMILKDFTPDVTKVSGIIQRAAEENRKVLHFHEVKEILGAYGIPVVRTERARNEEEAVRLSEGIGYSVVLKIDSGKIFHKLEQGGVFLNLRDGQAVRKAFRALKALASSLGDPQADMIIQPMVVKHGYELVIGAKKDPGFGSVIVFGTGGEFLEAMKDYAIGFPPLNQMLARRMMEETKIYRYLFGISAFKNILRNLEEILVRFCQMIIDFHHIKEIDINPFLISEKEGIGLDAGILLDEDALKNRKVFKEDLCPSHLSICPYPFKYARDIELGDGLSCLIRPIRAEDEPLIYAFFKSLSDETVTFRFCQRLVDMPHERLSRYCQIDYDRELAFVAVIKDEKNKECIIGEVRISKLPDLENAELAILIGDEWQGRGIGNKLMEYCIDIAKETGLKSLWMEILKNNRRMLSLGLKHGFKQAYDDEDMVRVALQL